MPIPKNYKELCIDFLYAYSELETVRTNKELDNKKNNLSKDIINIIPTEEVNHIKQTDLQKYKGVKLEQECIFTSCSRSKPITLLRHLRNAIAHGNLHQNGNYFELEDWNNSKKEILTALGKFEKNKIKCILELFRQ